MASSTGWQYGDPYNISSGQETTPAGSVTGATPSYYSAQYGGIAQTPDPTVSAYQAIQGNISNEGALSGLANYWNQFNQQQLINQQNAVNPYWSNTMAQLGQNAYSEAQGNIPQDVINQIGQLNAERGGGGGITADSPNFMAALLSAIGKTSLDMTNLGLTNLGSLEKMTPTASLFDTAPYQTTAADVQAAQVAANKSAAAAVPYWVAQTNLDAAKTGQTSGAAAAGGTPSLGGGAGSSANWWNPAGTTGTAGNWWDKAQSSNWWGTGTGGGTASGSDWWNTYGPGAYSNQQGQGEPGSTGLSTSQEDQLRAEGWTQSEIDSLLAYSSPDDISSLFSDSSSGYADVPATGQ